MLPTSSDIRNMTESKRIALGFQSRRYEHQYKSTSQLPPPSNNANWTKADPVQSYQINYQRNNLKTIKEEPNYNRNVVVPSRRQGLEKVNRE